MASVTLKEGGVEVRIEVVAAGNPIDPFDITHPDDVQALRREIRAWRRWDFVSRDSKEDEPAAWMELQRAIDATNESGALE